MSEKVQRILIIDDNENIHKDFETVLLDTEHTEELDALEAELFSENQHRKKAHSTYELDHAYQGEEGIAKVQKSLEENRPYALAFVDVRMPPGLDGIETIEKIWKFEKEIQTVICTAFSDYSLDDIVKRLGKPDRLLILKKPFDSVEVAQMANALTKKWSMARYLKGKEKAIETMNFERFQSLARQNEELIDENKRLREIVKQLEFKKQNSNGA